MYFCLLCRTVFNIQWRSIMPLTLLLLSIISEKSPANRMFHNPNFICSRLGKFHIRNEKGLRTIIGTESFLICSILSCQAIYYYEWGKKARKLHHGDIVNIHANVKHWQGAAPNSWFSHLAIEIEDGGTEWYEVFPMMNITK